MAIKAYRRKNFSEEQVEVLKQVELMNGTGKEAVRMVRKSDLFKGEKPRRNDNSLKIKLRRIHNERNGIIKSEIPTPIKTGNSGLGIRMTLTNKGKPSPAFSLMEILPLIIRANPAIEHKIYNLIKNEL